MNDMWGVYCNGDAKFVQCSELFDCDDPSALPRRLVSGKHDRLRKELDKEVKAKNWKRVEVLAHVLRKYEKNFGLRRRKDGGSCPRVDLTRSSVQSATVGTLILAEYISEMLPKLIEEKFKEKKSRRT